MAALENRAGSVAHTGNASFSLAEDMKYS